MRANVRRNMKRAAAVALASLALAVSALSVAAAQGGANAPVAKASPAAEQGIRSVLDAQVAAWDRGDLEGYWRSPELTFYSGGAVATGCEAALARYQRRYQGKGREMGTLDFTKLEIHILGDDDAWVGGRWHLKMRDGKDLGGLFTLIFKKLPEGWRIVHDHTSSD